MITGAFCGALASSSLSGVRGDVHGVYPASGVFGGILMMLGSRLAAGCTSGKLDQLFGVELLILRIVAIS